ncbi:anti-sigma F factor antagonist [Paenibacillus sp. E194]|jgi:anti-anti-sigma factor|uniref:Anti-sigma factor antagonist n=4 Tax=Paenibacillus TaxID=44249 RepID=A0A383R5U7_PAEAL|nr:MULTISPECIES: STAS domain-containing protein [Paenibacillus]KJB86566.1 anti-sigma F factor antagonist [Paenibacillus sp. E194]MCY9529575.1 STAS domain-containing protein [Paenibacillus alvei]MDT8979431.1 STAS domain-containing protein [Paenibacillus sp. chi10]SDF79571.1 anti-sigma B factor antagonist [Paenibacillus sp. cl6col]SYX81932.1 Anti-sigma factor antagonist [Paenibacillus alvei]
MMNGKKFAVKTVQQEGQVIVQTCGDLDLAAAKEFRSTMEPIVNDANTELTLDLKELTYIDSTGIGILISILKMRHEQKSAFRIVNVPTHVQKLFDMTGISKFLTPQA